MLYFIQLWSWKRLHMGQPDFGQPPVFPIAQHLDHDEVDNLLAEGPIRGTKRIIGRRGFVN